jgi:hypothetical protein
VKNQNWVPDRPGRVANEAAMMQVDLSHGKRFAGLGILQREQLGDKAA